MSVAIPGRDGQSAREGASEVALVAVRGGARFMRFVSDGFNAVLLVASAWATLRLWDKAKFYYAQSGGLPDPRDYGCTISHHQCGTFVQELLPTLHLRMYWLALAWVVAVVAGGFAVLTVGGLRWAYWRVHDYLSV